jgi:aspartate kinase
MTPTEVPLFNFIPLNEPVPTELPAYHVTVDLIRSEHLAAARSSIRDPKILEELQEEIERDCEWLRNFLLAAKVCFT